MSPSNRIKSHDWHLQIFQEQTTPNPLKHSPNPPKTQKSWGNDFLTICWWQLLFLGESILCILRCHSTDRPHTHTHNMAGSFNSSWCFGDCTAETLPECSFCFQQHKTNKGCRPYQKQGGKSIFSQVPSMRKAPLGSNKNVLHGMWDDAMTSRIRSIPSKKKSGNVQ